MADERTTQESPPTWSDSDSAPPVIAEKKRRLPPFLDHFNGRDLKIFFRCWVAVWVACLLIFIHPSLESIGTATFFAAYASAPRHGSHCYAEYDLVSY